MFFIDHNAKTTSFIDPRLPNDWRLLQAETSAAAATAAASNQGLLPPLPPRHQGASLTPPPSARGPSPTNMFASPNLLAPPALDGVNRRRSRSVGDEELNNCLSHQSLAYNDRVVAFLRQPNIFQVLKEKNASLVSNNKNLKDKVSAIRQEGTTALTKLSHDVEFTLILSMFENEIMCHNPDRYSTGPGSPRSPCSSIRLSSQNSSPFGSPGSTRSNHRAPAPYRRDFDAKLRNFYRKLESKGYGQGPSKLKLSIRREHLLEDAFNKIMSVPKKEMAKSKLYICFNGEEGLDYGGPSREFFFLLSREVFNPYYGLFEYSANDTYTVQVRMLNCF